MPKPDTKRIITFANQSDYISFRLVMVLSPLGEILVTATNNYHPSIKVFFQIFFLDLLSMTIQTLRHHVYEKQGGPKSIELKEIGPRFELRLYKVVTFSFS